MLRRRIENKIENLPEEEHFEFRKGKVNMDTIGMPIISERTFDKGEELCVLHRLTEGI
jgi:hypothetical protein